MPRPTDAMRRRARRATAAAATRYRTAVLERSRWLPAYLTAVDAADVARRAARVARRRPAVVGPWDEPDTADARLVRAELSATGELSLVVTGPAADLDAVDHVELMSGTERVGLAGALLERTDDWLRVSAPLPSHLPTERWHRVPTAMAVDVAHRTLALVLGPDAEHAAGRSAEPATEPGIEHRLGTGIARLDVEWAPPPGTAPELLLLGPDGTIAQRIPAAPTGGGTLTATIDTVPADAAVLTVAVPGTDRPIALVLAPGTDLVAAPPHGVARLGAVRVRGGYDNAGRLQLVLG